MPFHDARRPEHGNRRLRCTGIAGGDSGNNAGITDIQVVHIVRLEIRVDDRGLGIGSGPTGTYQIYEDEEDGDNLTYSASSNGSKVTVEVSNGILRVIGVSYLAVETITVTATDTGGKTASQSFRVLAKPNTG